MDENRIKNVKYGTRTTLEVEMLKIDACEVCQSISSFKFFLSLFLVSQGGNQHSLQAGFFQKSELCQHRSQRNGTTAELFSARPNILLHHFLMFSPASARPDSGCQGL